MLKNMLVGMALALSITTGCSKSGGGSCEEVFAHIKDLAGKDLGDMMDKSKDAAIAKCEKLPPEARECAMKATSMEELQKCSQK